MKKRSAWVRLVSLLLVGGLLGTMLPGALPQAAAASRQVNITIHSVKNCDVYYCEGDALIPIQQDEKIYKITTGNYGIILFAAPREGYALSAMTASGSAGDYYTISNGEPNGAGSEFYTYKNGQNIDNLKKVGYTDETDRAYSDGSHSKGLRRRVAVFQTGISYGGDHQQFDVLRRKAAHAGKENCLGHAERRDGSK